MLDLQAAELQHHEEQKETNRESGIQEVLSLVQKADAPQRNEVA